MAFRICVSNIDYFPFVVEFYALKGVQTNHQSGILEIRFLHFLKWEVRDFLPLSLSFPICGAFISAAFVAIYYHYEEPDHLNALVAHQDVVTLSTS